MYVYMGEFGMCLSWLIVDNGVPVITRMCWIGWLPASGPLLFHVDCVAFADLSSSKH